MKPSITNDLLNGGIVIFALAVSGCGSLSTRPFQQSPLLIGAASPQELRAQFFGATTILIQDERNAILVDGFFSRPGILDLLAQAGTIRPDSNRIDQALARINLPNIDYVLVAHSHHDHVMDAPIVARRKHARLVGSNSTRNVARGQELGHVRFIRAYAGKELHRGHFTIRIFASPHSHYAFEEGRPHRADPSDEIRRWLDHKLDGTIDTPLPSPAWITDYKPDINYVFLIEHEEPPAPMARMLIVPSASVPIDLGDQKADVVFLGIGDADKLSNEHIQQYWHEAVEKTGARLVVPVHWDNFFGALDDDARLEPFPAFIDDVACTMETITYLNAGRAKIAFMPLFKPVAFDFTAPTAWLSDIPAIPTLASDPFTVGCRAPDPQVRDNS